MKKFVKIFSIFAANGLIYGLNALYYCFIQLYLEKFHSAVSVGILLSVGPMVAIFAPILWGMLADKSKYKNNILACAVIGSAFAYIALQFGDSFGWHFAALLVLMFFLSPFGGLIDTITLEYSAESGFPYGPVRLTGTIVFGLLPMVLTIFTETNIYLIFWAYAVMAALCVLSLKFMPMVKGHASGRTKINFKPLFRDPRLMLMFLMIAVSQFAWGYYINFFPSYLTGTLGLPQSVWGVNVFITVLGEIPFFLLFNRIFRRFGIKRILWFAIGLSTLRYVGLAFFTTAPALLAVGLLTGLTPTLITYCCSYYINRCVAPEIKASGQTLSYALGVGIPKTIAGFAGGFMTDSLGTRASLFLCAAICAVSMIVLVASTVGDKSEALAPEK